MLSLRQLEYFVAVVDEGSFTIAADVLGVSQPALSQQIRALERSIDSPLFERLGRSNGLTPVGRAMLPHARAALAAGHGLYWRGADFGAWERRRSPASR